MFAIVANAGNYKSSTDKKSVYTVMHAVASWQIDHFKEVKHHNLDWTNGALYSGMMVWSQMADNKKYEKFLSNIGRRFRWQPYFRMYHADDIVVSQMYLDMYRIKKDKRILQPTQARLDFVVEHPSQGSLDLNYRDYTSLERWSWCDALFMAPPVYAKMSAITGEKKYLKFMHKEFLATYNYLFDKEESLFFRDSNFFNKKEENGKKVFWGRGNGWVMGGLVAILKELPQKSKYRPFYEKLFKQMAKRVAQLQDPKGYWHASMLDHKSYPNQEMSCSSFFCYALAYGVNSGLLDKSEYQPIVEKAWKAMVSCVNDEGKLGWVQPIGQDPRKVTADMTEVYGVGAFLLAGSEVVKM